MHEEWATNDQAIDTVNGVYDDTGDEDVAWKELPLYDYDDGEYFAEGED